MRAQDKEMNVIGVPSLGGKATLKIADCFLPSNDQCVADSRYPELTQGILNLREMVSCRTGR
jgi:hypothetical protein